MKGREYFQSQEKDQEYLQEKKNLHLRLSLANEILDMRLKRGYSQKELAELVGTKQANISRLESGLGNPTLNLLDRIVTALDAECEIRFKSLSVAQEEPSLPYALMPSNYIYEVNDR